MESNIARLEEKLNKITRKEDKKKQINLMLDFIKKTEETYKNKIRKKGQKRKESLEAFVTQALKNLPSQLLKKKVKEIKGGFYGDINYQVLNVETPQKSSPSKDNSSKLSKSLIMSFKALESENGNCFFLSERKVTKRILREKREKGEKISHFVV